jgi:Zn-dependent protease
LDGSKILAIVLPERTYAALMRYERYGFIVLAILLFTNVLDKPLVFLQGGLIDGISAIVEPLAKMIAGV